MRVSKRTSLKASLIGTGLPFSELAHLDIYLAVMRDMIRQSAGFRRAGSAALDLAYVAAGRLDGFWEFGLSPWDMAAGALLITEAGGLVGDLRGEPGYLSTGNIVAGTPKVFVQLLQTLSPHLTPALSRG
jgi:myo-inositol-1(or 4)-monophosphatase